MRGWWKLVGVAAGLSSTGLYAGAIAYDAAPEILVVLGSAITISFCLAFLAALTRAGPLAGPALVIVAYAASLVWVAQWVHSCPGCASGNDWTRRDAGIFLAFYYGIVFLMGMGTAVAGSVAGLWLKRANPPAAPSG
jgi:hypothetical protein